MSGSFVLAAPAILSVLLSGLSVALFVGAVIADRSGWFGRRREQLLAWLQLDSLNPTEARKFMMVMLAAVPLGFISGWMVLGGPPGGAAAAVGSLLVIRVYVTNLRLRLEAQMERQLAPAVDLLVALVRSQKTLPVAFGELARSQPYPICKVFQDVHNRIALASSVSVACDEVTARNRNDLVKLLLSAISVFAERGGNPIGPLQEMSTAIKKMSRLRERIGTASAQARSNTRTINGAGLFMLGLVWYFQPGLLKQLTGSALGVVLFAIGVGFWMFGYFRMRSLARIDP